MSLTGQYLAFCDSVTRKLDSWELTGRHVTDELAVAAPLQVSADAFLGKHLTTVAGGFQTMRLTVSDDIMQLGVSA